jgi:putative flippase GtrA
MFVVDWAFELITMDSTIANIAGFAIAIATVYVSVKTKCFTTITFKTNKNEKDN